MEDLGVPQELIRETPKIGLAYIKINRVETIEFFPLYLEVDSQSQMKIWGEFDGNCYKVAITRKRDTVQCPPGYKAHFVDGISPYSNRPYFLWLMQPDGTIDIDPIERETLSMDDEIKMKSRRETMDMAERIAVRRKQVKRLLGRGWKPLRISEELRCSLQTIYKDKQFLEKQGRVD